MSSLLGEIGIFTSILLGFQTIVFFASIFWLAQRIIMERKAFKEVAESLRLMANPDPEQLEEIFTKVEGSRYYTLWHRYRQRIPIREPYQEAFNTYFDAEAMRRVLGYRSEVETVSQVHIALGVLGSLFSVVWTWSGGGIDPEGIFTALYPFLWGVILLVVWLIVDRILVSPLEGKVEHHTGMLEDVLLRAHHGQWMEKWKQEFVAALENGLSPLLQQMKRIEEERMEEREGVLELLRSIEHSLQTMEREGARHEAHFTEQMENLGLLIHTMQEVTTELVSVIPKLEDVVQGIDTLKEGLGEMQEGQQQTLMELATEREKHNGLLQQTMQEMEDHVKGISKQVASMQEQWTGIKDEFIELRRNLERSGEKFASDIHNGLDKTFDHFDRELTEAMKKFSQLNRRFTDSHEKLLRELEELPRRLESVIQSKECDGKQ